jgi:hypothetical protein
MRSFSCRRPNDRPRCLAEKRRALGIQRPLPPITRAALAHEMLLAIHPFLDGNGRTARLVLNLQLMQAGYPVTLLLQGWRLTYTILWQVSWQPESQYPAGAS